MINSNEDAARALAGLQLRLSQLAGSNLAKFARDLGVPQTTVHTYLAKGRLPSSEFLARIQQKLGISLDWLFTGKGEMYLSEDRKSPEAWNSASTSIPVTDPEMKDLIEWAHESEAVRGVILYLKEKEIKPFAAKQLPGIMVDPETGRDLFFSKGKGAEILKDAPDLKRNDSKAG